MAKDVLVDKTVKCTDLLEEYGERAGRIFDALDGMEVHKAKKLLNRCFTALQLLDFGCGDGARMSMDDLLNKMQKRLGLPEKHRNRARVILNAVTGLDIAWAEDVLSCCSQGLQFMDVEFTD